jgi:hypothetical protein
MRSAVVTLSDERTRLPVIPRRSRGISFEALLAISRQASVRRRIRAS